MKTCSDANCSVKGFIITVVAKQKINPNVIEIGRAGSAFLVMANSNSVKHKPYNKNFMII